MAVEGRLGSRPAARPDDHRFSALWIAGAWRSAFLLITLPPAAMVHNRLRAVTTLHRY